MNLLDCLKNCFFRVPLAACPPVQLSLARSIRLRRRPGLTDRLAMALPLLGWLVALAGCQTVPLPDPAVRYIAFGDSTTASPADRQYWEFLRDDLGLPADSFAGQGQGGEPTSEGLTTAGDAAG